MVLGLRCSRSAATVLVLVAMLLAGHAAVVLHHGTHATQTQDCAVCIVGHSGGPIPTTLELPFQALRSRRPLVSISPIEPEVPSLDSATARAPPLSILAA